MVLALEFWTPPFHFSTNASANLIVFVVKRGVTPQVELRRLPKGFIHRPAEGPTTAAAADSRARPPTSPLLDKLKYRHGAS